MCYFITVTSLEGVGVTYMVMVDALVLILFDG